MSTGRSAVVEAIGGPFADRLKAIGICAGHMVCVQRAGDPAIVQVLQTCIGLSAQLADQILVRPLEDKPLED